jgi:UDP:flavonoid glycosyltransferase YjiC (YdhE family)
MAEQKSPSVTMSEIPSNMVAQAAAAARANAEEDSNLNPSRTAEYLNPNSTDENLPPPAYGDEYGHVSSQDPGLGSKATLRSDGRVNININQTSRQLSSLLVPALRSQLDLVDTTQVPPPYIPTSLGGAPGQPPPPPLNVVIHVVGSRGDVQPFVALGKVLKDQYGHRVRLATHPVFRDFVTENGLEFFNIGGDPSELMAFMVKNPGLMPGFDVMRRGDIGKRRKEIGTMIKGCWRSCIESGDGTGVAVNDNTTEEWMRNTDASVKPFIADAIIANPPSFAHIHCAEKLGCPLHMMFTMPYSPTQAFPHPLANIQSTNADPHLTNFISYTLVEMLTWQGLGDVINRFRVKDLSLDPISLIWAPGMLTRLRVPYTYCWSPALIPKPKDWGNQISIAGFYFLSLASNFTPPPDLKAFLDAGPPPVYIGFGSIVLDDPNGMTKLIFDAVRKTGQRALVSKGWGGFGADELGIPEGVFMLGNVPHDWLFKNVSCVVHHGGAGTTAAGIACGVPTVIVPFFGDQPFWGAMVAKAGAGPDPINHKDLTADNLAEAINKALEPATRERAQDLANSISHEDGTESGAQSFHQFLEVDKMRCSIAPSKAAVWRLKRTEVRLSALAATTLATEGLLDFKDLKLYRPREYEADEGPPEPISGGAGALTGTISTMMMGVADFPVAALKALRIHPDAVPKKTATDPQSTSQESPSEQQLDQPGSSNREMAVSTTSRSTSPGRGASTGGSFNLDESFAKMGSPHLTAEGKNDGEKRSRSSSLAAALQGRLGSQLRHRSGSRSGSNSRSSSPHRTNTNQSQSSTQTQPQGGETNLREVIDAAFGTSKGVSRIVGAGFKSPMDFTHALAKGFHNAPKLYGDESVRKPDKITDFRSGLRAATKEFGFGMFDGITGLVTQPMEGAKKEGAAGFLKGFGKGIGGIVLKPGAAIFGIPAYTMKGVYKELQQLSGSSVQNYIIAARTAQGYDEWHRSSAQERQEIIRRWKVVESEVKKKKFIHEQFQDMLKKQWEGENRDSAMGNDGQARGSRSFLGIRPRSRANSRAARVGTRSEATTPSVEVTQHTEPPKYEDLQYTRGASGTELERAIQSSVADTSRGDPEQDAMIERAIRASIAELASSQQSSGNNNNNNIDDEDEILRKAIAASMAEHGGQHPPAYEDTSSPEHDEELAAALKASLANSGHQDKRLKRQTHSTDSEWDTNSNSADDDEYRLAVKASQDQQSAQRHHDDAELQQAISQSQESHKANTSAEEEERVVLEYVKKQSLLEEQHRRNVADKGKGKVAEQDADEEDDEDFKRALEESLKQEGKKGGRA